MTGRILKTGDTVCPHAAMARIVVDPCGDRRVDGREHQHVACTNVVVVQSHRLVDRQTAQLRQSPVACVVGFNISMHDVNDLWQQLTDVHISRQRQIDRAMCVIGTNRNDERAQRIWHRSPLGCLMSPPGRLRETAKQP